jgi:hypothetical protein
MGFSKFLLIRIAKIDWQTSKVFEQLRALYSSQKLGITALTDCNTKNDFKDCSITSVFAVHLKVFWHLYFYATPILTF